MPLVVQGTAKHASVNAHDIQAKHGVTDCQLAAHMHRRSLAGALTSTCFIIIIISHVRCQTIN
jgi:hypothetical protein